MNHTGLPTTSPGTAACLFITLPSNNATHFVPGEAHKLQQPQSPGGQHGDHLQQNVDLFNMDLFNMDLFNVSLMVLDVCFIYVYLFYVYIRVVLYFFNVFIQVYWLTG